MSLTTLGLDSHILTALRTISAHLESLVDLKRQELAFLTGEPAKSSRTDNLTDTDNLSDSAEVLYTSDEQDRAREYRAMVMGRLNELRDDPLSWHEGIDRAEEGADLSRQSGVAALFQSDPRGDHGHGHDGDHDPDPDSLNRIGPDVY